jgi:2-(1,2-epoxy-1,2-dihydrophenyl)acetyl-CoA isomerase
MRELDTGTPDLTGAVEDGVAVLTMSRPERRNALSAEMLTALATALVQVEADPEVGCVVLTGAGKAFCAGGDVKGFAAAGGQPRPSFEERLTRQREGHRRTALKLYELRKPTIAMINGPAAGAGFALALACDLRYAADSAVLTTAFAKVGLAGDYGGTWFLTRLVGTAKARELYYFSDRLAAAEAERIGLVNAVFEADKLREQVLDLARRLASGPAVAYRYMKENLNRAVTGSLEESLDIEALHHQRTFDTEDHKEAAAAFVAKRPPNFTGR